METEEFFDHLDKVALDYSPALNEDGTEFDIVKAAEIAKGALREEAFVLLNSLDIVGPNMRHEEQGMWPDGKHSDDDTWDGPGWCVCRRVWPCEAKRLGEVVAALASSPAPAGLDDLRAVVEVFIATNSGWERRGYIDLTPLRAATRPAEDAGKRP